MGFSPCRFDESTRRLDITQLPCGSNAGAEAVRNLSQPITSRRLEELENVLAREFGLQLHGFADRPLDGVGQLSAGMSQDGGVATVPQLWPGQSAASAATRAAPSSITMPIFPLSSTRSIQT